MTEIIVTIAKPGDERRIARLLEEWVRESAIQWPPVEPELMEEWVLFTIENGYAVLAHKTGRLVGVAAVQPCYMPWNTEQPMMRDAFFYVPRSKRPDRVEEAAKRVPAVAEALMTAIKLHCAKVGLPLILEVISGVNTDKVDRWYGITGAKYCGGTFVVGLPEKAAQEAA
jgi:hypothetical protein